MREYVFVAMVLTERRHAVSLQHPKQSASMLSLLLMSDACKGPENCYIDEVVAGKYEANNDDKGSDYCNGDHVESNYYSKEINFH